MKNWEKLGMLLTKSTKYYSSAWQVPAFFVSHQPDCRGHVAGSWQKKSVEKYGSLDVKGIKLKLFDLVNVLEFPKKSVWICVCLRLTIFVEEDEKPKKKIGYIKEQQARYGKKSRKIET